MARMLLPLLLSVDPPRRAAARSRRATVTIVVDDEPNSAQSFARRWASTW